jgi:hypothetical protein
LDLKNSYVQLEQINTDLEARDQQRQRRQFLGAALLELFTALGSANHFQYLDRSV